jgi:hypothetical protein
MAKQIAMDATGDTRHEFHPADTDAVAEAAVRGIDMRGVNRSCAHGGTSELIRNFNPAANETLFFPRLRGELRALTYRFSAAQERQGRAFRDMNSSGTQTNGC